MVFTVHNPNGKSIGSAVLAQLMAESPYTYNGLFFSPRIDLSNKGIWSDPYLIHGFLGPPESST